MRVLFDPQTFLRQRTGGISRLFTDLVREFDDRPELGVDAVVSFRRANNVHAASELAHRGISASPRWLPREILYAPWWLTGNRIPPGIDIVHHTYYDGRFLRTPAGLLRVTTVYDMIPEIFAGTELATGSHLRKRDYVEAADLVICISESTRRDLFHHFGPIRAHVVVIPLAVKAGFGPHHPPLEHLPPDYLLYVGSRAGYKDFTVLPDALAILRSRGIAIPLVVVGKAFTSDESASLQARQLADSVTNVQLSDADLRRAYANATAVVQTSRYEGFGLTPLEAMASGVPVVIASASAMPEVGGDVARYFQPGHADDLAEQLERLVSDGELRRWLGERGLDRAAQFTSQRMAERTAAAYRDALSRFGS